jgi:hypothetical protein
VIFYKDIVVQVKTRGLFILSVNLQKLWSFSTEEVLEEAGLLQNQSISLRVEDQS